MLLGQLAEFLKSEQQYEQPKERHAPDAGAGWLADSDKKLDAGESRCSLQLKKMLGFFWRVPGLEASDVGFGVRC